jgi:hypothetical protein
VIILDWAEAGDLAQLLKARADSEQPLTTEEVLTLFMQVGGDLGCLRGQDLQCSTEGFQPLSLCSMSAGVQCHGPHA